MRVGGEREIERESCIPHFVYASSVGGQFGGSFHILAIINNATKNIHVQVFFISLGYTPTNRTAGSYINSTSYHLRNHQTVS